MRLSLEPWADASGTGITTSFVVEATGRKPIAGKAADDCAQRLYFDGLVAISLFAPSTLQNDNYLRVAPSRSGWWYTVTLGGEGVAVYLTDGDLLPRENMEFAELLEREWREALPDVGAIEVSKTMTSAWRCRDARTTCRNVLQRGHWLPIGDAAFTLDPLSGFGLTQALRMADRAAHAVDRYLATGSATALSGFAVAFWGEFANAQATGQQFFARCARRFPDSEFWHRRLHRQRLKIA
jgi:flavin-dependent dehydrogenase